MSTFAEAINAILIDHDLRCTPYDDTSAERSDTVRQILAMPEMQAIRGALYQMIIHIDSEWGHEDDEDLIESWGEVFHLPANVIEWIRP